MTLRDFSTPESAIESLEAAYRAHDIEAAVSCKDFRAEAELMLQSLNPQFAQDEQIILQTAELLELACRKEMDQNGFPDFTGVRSTFPKIELLNPHLAIVTEVCHFPARVTTTQQLYVSKTDSGWRVLNPVSDEPPE
jgi:hypothetical protein